MHAYLQARSISKRKIIIPMKAIPGHNKLITRFFFRCKMEAEKDSATLKWNAVLFLPEAIAVICLIVLVFVALIPVIQAKTAIGKHQIFFLCLLVSSLCLVFLNYYWQYKKCQQVFKEIVDAGIHSCAADTSMDKNDQGTVL